MRKADSVSFYISNHRTDTDLSDSCTGTSSSPPCDKYNGRKVRTAAEDCCELHAQVTNMLISTIKDLQQRATGLD